LLNVRAVNKEKIVNFLTEKHGTSEYMAELAAVFSEGNVGKAINFATSDEFSALKKEVLGELKKFDSMRADELYRTAKEWADDKVNLQERLLLAEMWYRDVLVVKSTDKTDNTYFRDEDRELYRQAMLFGFEELSAKLDAVSLFKERMRFNVNAESALMVMMLALRDNAQA
jgi:DNA polymerase-3 subunit delta'